MQDIKIVYGVFHFLDLPAEIRNKIYRYLLTMEGEGTIIAKKGKDCEPFQPGKFSTNRGGLPYELLSENYWDLEYPINTAILCVNRKIYREASNILYDDNLWIIVTVNAKGFSKSLIEAGFPVISQHVPARIKNPVLRVNLRFPSLDGRGEHETFLIEEIVIVYFCRALWLTKGIRELHIDLQINPKLGGYSASFLEEMLLLPFISVRGARKARISGCLNKEKAEIIVRAMMTPLLDYAEVEENVGNKISFGNAACRREEWTIASTWYMWGLIFLEDCLAVFEPMSFTIFVGGFDKIKVLSVMACKMSSNLALARVKTHLYKSAIRNATYAIYYAETPGFHTAKALFRRGLAHIGLKDDRSAATDFLDALKLAPTDPAIQRELKGIKRRMGSDPEKREKAFQQLVKSIQKQKKDEDSEMAENFARLTAGATIYDASNIPW
ncbi:MAG: peptidyl-prolyl cis-trans isomerase cpr6 [Pycnora praestabilis]|nr:MAG: peptidyl-prolyl cis-trans isomerase cpr6 [Pycnora praestabilis]